MKKILVRQSLSHANKWIYDGFASGWEKLGYDVERWTHLLPESKINDNILMCATWDFSVHEISGFINLLSKASKIYMYVSPTKFPPPYGQHPNFVDFVSRNPTIVNELKKLNNIIFWNFGDVEKGKEWFKDWGTVHHVPLAFDSVSYERIYDPKYEFDVCFIGSRANNGFDTKYQIMKNYLAAFKDSGLKCAFFIDKNLTHEQECKILTNSRVCLNIHDEYQQKLGLDTNERTWKSLGLNGLLVSDYVGTVIPDYVYQCSSPQEMVEKVQELIKNYPLADKERNSSLVMKEHTYIERCKKLEKLLNL